MTELARISAWRDAILAAAAKHSLDPAIVAAIISRETLGWNVLGDNGHGHGLMQIDDSVSREDGRVRDPEAFAWCHAWRQAGKRVGTVRIGAVFPLFAGNEVMGVERGCLVLALKIRTLRSVVRAEDDLVRAAVAAYNTGEGNVKRSIRKKRDVDFTTKGRNYSADVLTRAEVFRQNGFSA